MFPRKSRQSNLRNRRQQNSKSILSRLSLIIAIAATLAILSGYVALAAISISPSVVYSQSFDGMGIPPSNPAPSSLPVSFRADTVSAVRTLGNYFSAAANTNRVAGANMATNAANGSYNFGSGTTTIGGSDRAAGFISSGTATMSGNLYAELVNDSGNDLSGVQIAYDVEKYRNGSNPSGFRIQLYYSSDGLAWTNAGPGFLTSFSPDADNSGFATAPGITTSVNNTLNIPVVDKAKLYLAWNYSVSSGFTTTNAQALGIDNISILGTVLSEPTNPSGVGNANPASVGPSETVLLTLAVTPGSNPTSVNHTVTADLFSIGGSSAQQLFDDGSNGDVTPNDNVFSYLATVANATSPGAKTLGSTITEVGGLGRIGTGSISMTVLASTNPSGIGAANPNSVLPTESSVLTVTVTPGSNPPSSNLVITADLSTIGGSSTQQFFNDGVSGGDLVAGDGVFTYTAIVLQGTTAGGKSLQFSITDAQGRSGSGSIALTVQQPPPPVDHIVISQLYGGGGNSGATFTNDYIELYNPTGIAFNLAGWSLQYASATGSSWTNKQPIGGTIAPGEYFLVSLGSGGANGSPLPVSANISGDINMSATTGKVALVSNSINLIGNCPNGVDPDIVDFVGYGATANCFEGASRAPAPSNSTAILRKANGAQDTNQNNDDFQTGVPNPRRTAPITELGPWVAGTNPELDGFNVPYDATVTIDFSEAVDVTGNWYEINCTSSGQHNSATVASYNNFKGYHITPNNSFAFGEQCTVTVFHNNVNDQDLDDSIAGTDTLFADYVWTFTVVGAGAPAPYQPSVHLTMGNPSNAAVDLLQFNNYLMEKPSFAVSYNRDKGTPNWVSWHLEPTWFGSLPRFDTFRPDPAVSPGWYRVQSTDYFATGFDRGHMTPNADRDNENRTPINQETYLMSNIVPQAPDNNQGPWANQENDLRTMLTQNGEDNELYIIAGPLGVGGSGANGGITDTVANGNVTVPAFTWKVVLLMPRGENDISRVTAATKTIAIMMPNVQGIRNDPWQNYLTTVDAVEQATGYDFFSELPDIIEKAIEAGTNGVNPPATENQGATTSEDTNAAITLNAVSPQASPTFTSEIVNPPSHGTVSGTGLNLSYTPGPDYHGPDSFTFRVNDGALFSNTSTFSITVTEVNDAPTAGDDTNSTDEDTQLDFSATDLTMNDSTGPANESLQNLAVTIVTATVDTHGSVALDTGTITYTPNTNYHGPASFTYQVCEDGTTNGSPDPRCISAVVNITVNPVNDAPTADSQSVNTNGNTPVSISLTGGDLETANANLNFVVTVTPTHGSLSGSGANLSYIPALNYSGPDSFKFTVTDTGDGSAAAITSSEATVSFMVNDTINPVMTPPANVTVGTGLGATGCGVLIGEATLGTASASDNSGVVSIERTGVPPGNIFPVGTTIITYTAIDGTGNSAQATQTVIVNDTTPPVLSAPAPTSATANSSGQAPVPDVVAGATASDLCSAVTVTQSPAAGTLVGIGTHTITLTATDAAGNTQTATTTFAVQSGGGALTFTLSVLPEKVKRGRFVVLKTSYSNQTGAAQMVTFKLRYASPCGNATIGDIGPIKIKPKAHGSANLPLYIPRSACTGVYTLTLESFVGGMFNGSTTATLTVMP